MEDVMPTHTHAALHGLLGMLLELDFMRDFALRRELSDLLLSGIPAVPAHISAHAQASTDAGVDVPARDIGSLSHMHRPTRVDDRPGDVVVPCT